MSRHGFITPIVIVILLLIAAGVGAYILRRQQTAVPASSTITSSPSVSAEPAPLQESVAAGWKTYHDETLGLDISYPGTYADMHVVANSPIPFIDTGDKVSELNIFANAAVDCAQGSSWVASPVYRAPGKETSTTITVDGMRAAYRSQFETYSHQGLIEQRTYVCVPRTPPLVIDFHVRDESPSVQASYADLFNRIMATIRFTK